MINQSNDELYDEEKLKEYLPLIKGISILMKEIINDNVHEEKGYFN